MENKKKIIKFIKERYIYIFSYLYLFSSVIFFLLGNVKYIISVPLSIIMLFALYKAILNSPKMKVSLFSSKKKILIIIIIILAWVTIGGIGGFVYQNPWDHKFRNAIFKDLVFHSWPVVQGSKALCYYFGFWLPAAIIGKLFGLTLGYAFQTFWAAVGVFLTYGMICQYLKNVKIKNMILFILFSGLDIVAFFLFSKTPLKETLLSAFSGIHLEWATTYFQSSSNTTAIFWIYNQIIPFWVGMMLLLQQQNNKSYIFIYALMLLYSPFPLVGLAPVMVYYTFRKQKQIKEKNILKNCWLKIKLICTFENISSLFLIAILALFFKSNTAANKIGLIEINSKVLFNFVIYFFLEYGIYLLFIYKSNKHDPILKILIITVIFCSFIRLGNYSDFSMRTNLPLVFYLMLLVMKYLEQIDLTKGMSLLFIGILYLGTYTPMNEFIRTIRHEIVNVRIEKKETSRSDSLPTVFDRENNECYDNFIANRDSMFFKYLAKK